MAWMRDDGAEADLTTLECRVKGLFIRLQSMFLTETAALQAQAQAQGQAQSFSDIWHTLLSYAFAHPDLPCSGDASDDKPLD